MRRPLAFAGFTLLCAHLLCMMLGNTFALVSLLVSVCVFVLLFFVKTNNNRVISSLRGCCFLFLCGCLCFFLQYQIQTKPLECYHNTKQYVSFTVMENQGTYDDRGYFVVKAKGLYPESENKSCKVRLTVAGRYTMDVGDQVGAVISLSANPHPSLMAQDIFLTARYEEEASPQILAHRKTLPYYTNKAKTALQNAIGKVGGDDASVLISGICLGEANRLSPALQKDFYGVGLGHLVAVSGLHTSQIGGVLIGLFLFIAKRKRLVKLFSAPFVWGFVLLTGASYSSLRAALMFSFFALGSCFLRKPDTLNTLGGAVTIILLIHPFSVGSLGFLASISACTGLILLATPFSNRVLAHLPKQLQNRKPIAYLVQGICATCSALLFTVPCNFLGFHTLSPLAPLANLVCVPLATAILICGLLGSLLSFIPPFSVLGILVLWFAKGMASLIALVAKLLAKIPFHSLPQATPFSFVAILLFVAVCLWFWFYPRTLRPTLKGAVLVVLCAALCLSSLLPPFLPKTEEFCFLTNDYYNALAVISGDTVLYLGDRMTYELEQYLSSRGVTAIDLWVLPKRPSYTTTLTQIPVTFDIKEVLTYPQATTLGYLVGLPEQTPTAFTATQTVGTLTVRVLDDFKSFEITTPNTTLYYNFGASHSTPTAPFSFVNHKASENGSHTLSYQGTSRGITSPTVVRISPNGHRIYQPVYWY